MSIPTHAAKFSFVTLGDTVYNDEPDYPVYDALIQRINDSKPAFTIHVGDIWGGSECLEKDHLDILNWFSKYQAPVIYTPGDNEWTDCIDPKVITAYWRTLEKQAKPGDEATLTEFRSQSAKAHRPHQWALDSLQRIRQMYFSDAFSLGQEKIPLTRQSMTSNEYKEFVENSRWMRGDVLFATVHVVGSNNGLSIASTAAAKESTHRNRANIEWITAAFNEANKQGAKAVVLAMHATIFERGKDPKKYTGNKVRGGNNGPYSTTVRVIKELGEKFGKPVLLIHGDWHELVIDRPFLVSNGEHKKSTGGNITRLQVYGAPEIRAVKVDVDTNTPWVFSFSPLYNK